MIFDEQTRLSGPIGPQPNGHNRWYTWSTDYSVEVERGWIARGDSFHDLARRLGVPGDELERTAQRYNRACSSGDDVYGRAAESMTPVAVAPVYGVPLWPRSLTTQGGPRRNARAEVLDFRGRPIPGLFSAAELGSMWGQLYPGAGNLVEALVTGQIAARTALNAEAPVTR